MNCQQVQECFSDYMDGTLNPRRTDQIREHLTFCSSCRSEWHAFQSLLQNLQSLPSIEPSNDFDQELRRRIQEIRPRSETNWRFFGFSRRWLLPAITSLLLFAVLGGYLYLRPLSDRVAAPLTSTPGQGVAMGGPLLLPDPPAMPSQSLAGGSASFAGGSASSTNYVLYTVSYEEPEGLIGF